MAAPLAWPAAALLAGAAAGGSLGLAPEPWLALLAALCAVSALCRHGVSGGCFLTLVSLAHVAAGAALGGTAANRANHSPLRELFDRRSADGVPLADPVMIEGMLREDAARTDYGASLTVDVTHISVDGPPTPTRGRVRVAVAGSLVAERIAAWTAGRAIRVPTTLRRAERYLNPGVPDQEQVLARRGVALLGSAKSAALVEIVAPASWPAEQAARIRWTVRRTVARSVGRFDPRSAAIVVAILIGDRAGLDEETERRLQHAGTFHVIAISGGNIAIAAALLLGVLRHLGTSPQASALAVGLGLSGYAYLVGGGASVMRATVVAVAYFSARVLDQRARGANVLALAASGLAAARPLDVIDAAFDFTFAATIGIVVGVPGLVRLFRARLSHRPQLAGWALPVVAMGFATICAELALWPLSAAYFSRVTFAGLALNFLAIPLMAIVQVVGSIACGTALLSDPTARVLGIIAHLAAWALVESARLIELAPALVVRVPPPPVLAIGAYYAGGGFWLCAAPGSVWRRGAAAAVGALAIWIFFHTPGEGPRGRLRVTVFDVGQGDATLVQCPDGTTMLIDAAGASGFDLGERVLAPALWARGVRRLDRLVVTHGDPDHVGGALAVLRDFRPREIWEGVPVPPHEPLRLLKEAGRQIGATWREVRAGERRQSGDADIRILHPSPPDWERQEVRNDDSIVLEVVYGKVAILLPGDIGRSVEPDVARRLEPNRWRVVKMPHHGSAGSSSSGFVAAAGPRVVIVSAGRGNRYGHPAASALERYRRAGAAVFRTDRDGAVTITTDGMRVEIAAMTGRAYFLPVLLGSTSVGEAQLE